MRAFRYTTTPSSVDDDFAICPNGRMDMCLCCQANVSFVLQLMMTFLYVKRHIWVCACVVKPTFSTSMSKRTYGHVLVLPSRRLGRPAVDDDFVIRHRNISMFHVLGKESSRKFHKITITIEGWLKLGQFPSKIYFNELFSVKVTG